LSNIDADRIRDGGPNLSRTEEKLVEMTNGCICCTLRDDRLAEVYCLVKEGLFDYLLMEATRISEPLPIAGTFCAARHEARPFFCLGWAHSKLNGVCASLCTQ